MRRLLTILALPTTLAAQVNRQVRLEVVALPSGIPLQYAVVAVPDRGLERFMGPSGVVVIGLPPGNVRVTVKRLGFTPTDTLLTITDAPNQSHRIGLERLSIRLGTVRVDAWPPCETPGVPDRTKEPETAGVVDQLRQNAERFDLLLRTYPFVYTAERVLSEQRDDGSERTQVTDTILVSGDPAWRYHPGGVLSRQVRGLIFKRFSYTMRLPSLRDFASEGFLDHHCFYLAGVEDKSGQRLLRMDIVASTKLSDADVNVAVWLDTTDFRLRFATLELTRIPREMPTLLRFRSEITYLELLPHVPVMYVTVAENRHRIRTITPPVTELLFERQQLLDVRYLGAHPESAPPDPAADTTRAPPH